MLYLIENYQSNFNADDNVTLKKAPCKKCGLTQIILGCKKQN